MEIEVMNFIKQILNHFDFAYMLTVNVVTYIVIKSIDFLNGDKAVPTWLKRIIAVICGIIIGLCVIELNSDKLTIFYSFFISLISWDVIFKPILNILGNKFNYKK